MNRTLFGIKFGVKKKSKIDYNGDPIMGYSSSQFLGQNLPIFSQISAKNWRNFAKKMEKFGLTHQARNFLYFLFIRKKK